MDPVITDGQIVGALIALATLGTSTIGFAVAWIRARERANIAERSIARLDAAGIESRFDRIDQAVETIAVEIERVAESERFQSRLMASRFALPDRAPGAGRVVTPH